MCVIYSGVGINYCYEFCFCYRQKESSERVGGEQRGAQMVQRHYSTVYMENCAVIYYVGNGNIFG